MSRAATSLLDTFLANHGRGFGDPFPGPFGSPLEERFAEALRPHLEPRVGIEQQRPFVTAIGRFVVDFVFTAPEGTRIAVECDGAEFHEATRDAWRDAALLREEKIDLMVRIDGRFLNVVPADVIYLLSTIAPSLVSSRGRQNIERLSSTAAQRYNRQTPGLIIVEYPTIESLRDADAARRHANEDPDAWEADDAWYTEANHRAETGPAAGILYLTYEGPGASMAGYGWKDRARVIARNPGARLRDLMGLPLGGFSDPTPDPVREAFRRARDEEEPVVPAELAYYLLPSKAPDVPPYTPSLEWQARREALEAAEPLERPTSDRKPSRNKPEDAGP